MTTSMLNEVFELLAAANDLEETEKNRVEAATKYYEAVYLMKRYIQRLPVTEDEIKTRQLLQDKVQHYERIASALMKDESSMIEKENSSDVPKKNTHNKNNTLSLMTPGKKPQLEDPSIITSRPEASSTASASDFWQSPQSKKSDYSSINALVSRANTKLMHALDMDEGKKTKEAVAAYLEAAELYLQAIKLTDIVSGADAIAVVIRRRLEQTLDRIELLRRNNSYVPRKLQQAPKQPQDDISSSSCLTAEEISILKRSSIISSGLFLPWSDEDANKIAVSALNPISLYRDPGGFLRLSPKQQTRFHKWARPAEIVKIRQHNGQPSIKVVLTKFVTPYSIRQQCVTDCSFIAGLCICAAFERRFRKPLISSLLYPKSKDGTPILNPEGKYMVKLWLNGVARGVTIDDYLPIDKYGNLLCSHTSSNAMNGLYLELWVSLIEKAYMKLSGGYDFPGSNSGVDLFSLTGWIPERILFAQDATKVRDFETHPERAWDRISSASSYGDCLITVSTERTLSIEEVQSTDLVSGHAYAVLSVIQTQKGIRLLQLKNPWAHHSWNGRFSCHDMESWKDPSFRAEVGYNPDLAREQDDGVFWICWDDILKYFQNFHLSWNPFLFKHRFVMHGFWPKDQGPVDDTYNIGENPQYILSLSDQALAQNATIWILISRHVTKQEQEGSEAKDYLTVHVHRNDQKKSRIWYPGASGNCVLTGAYTNNPQVLVRYDVNGPKDRYLSLVLSQYKKTSDLGFTLSCYSTESFGLSQPARYFNHTIKLEAAWTTTRCGGPIGTNTFEANPAFAVLITAGVCTVQFRVCTIKATAVNVVMVPVASYGQGVREAIGKPVVDSGKYRHGFVATQHQKVEAGAYVVVVSNFNIGETGRFQLLLATSSKVKMEEIQNHLH